MGLTEWYALAPTAHTDAEYNMATLRELFEIRDVVIGASKHADPEYLDMIDDKWDAEVLKEFLDWASEKLQSVGDFRNPPRRRQEVDA